MVPFDILPKSGRNKPYIHTHCYNNGQLEEQSYYVNEQLHGEYKFWFYNGQLKGQCYYVNGLLHGKWKRLHDNGLIKDQRYFVNGQLITSE